MQLIYSENCDISMTKKLGCFIANMYFYFAPILFIKQGCNRNSAKIIDKSDIHSNFTSEKCLNDGFLGRWQFPWMIHEMNRWETSLFINFFSYPYFTTNPLGRHLRPIGQGPSRNRDVLLHHLFLPKGSKPSERDGAGIGRVFIVCCIWLCLWFVLLLSVNDTHFQ